MLKNSVNHQALDSFEAPARIVIPAANTQAKPKIPNIGFGMWSKALACGLAITGEQATIGLKLQLVTWAGFFISSIFSTVKIVAAESPMEARSTSARAKLLVLSIFFLLINIASIASIATAEMRNKRTSERITKTEKKINMIGKTVKNTIVQLYFVFFFPIT